MINWFVSYPIPPAIVIQLKADTRLKDCHVFALQHM